MLFNSWSFALFFPLVTAVYFALPHRFRWAWLLVASCYFYMAFVPAYILILAVTIAVDYGAGLMIARSEGAARRRWLVASVVVNLGMLGFFKYFNFFNANVAALASLLHWNYPIQALSILLPIGLSFHVFQSLSYTIEVYRGNQPAERHAGIFALYVMFFPQLVAGPIERPQNLLHQFHAEQTFDARRASDGLRRMGWGLLKKVVIADHLAAMTAPIFAHPQAYGGPVLALAVLGFSYQIYCDFSGYSDMAVGSARVLGFELMNNFNRPYAARSVRSFWSRWHISLSTWFRDYVYLPLGGNRRHVALNLVVVFLLSGLWHGAAWTFVAWGALHAAYMVVGRWLGPRYARLRPAHAPLFTAGEVFLTFLLVSFAWIFFRAGSLTDGWYIASHLARGWLASPAAVLHAFQVPRSAWLIVLGGAVVVEAAQWLHARGKLVPWFMSRPMWFRWTAYELALAVLFVGGEFENRAFIYFQF